MPFSLQLAADLYGVKTNLEVEFPTFPSVSDVIAMAQSVFSSEAAAIKPPGQLLQNISVSRIQVYNDDTGAWADLVTPSQLSDHAQCYVFNAETTYEVQQQIPPARRPSRPTPMSPHTSTSLRSPAGTAASPLPTPSRTALAISAGRHASPPRSTAETTLVGRLAPPENISTQADKARYLFEEMDTNGNRVIEPSEWNHLIRALGIDFSASTLNDLFAKADLDRDGVLTIGEFNAFFGQYSTLLDALHYRLRDVHEARALQDQLAREQMGVDQAREQRQRADATVAESGRVVQELTLKMHSVDAERQRGAARETELRSLVQCGQEEVAAAERARGTALSEQDAVRDRDNQAQANLAAAQRSVVDNEARLNAEQRALNDAHDKERQLQTLLLEAQRESERQAKLVQAASVDLVHARDREATNMLHVNDSRKALQNVSDRVAACDREVLLKIERQKELKAVMAECQQELQRVILRLEDSKRDVATAVEREKSNRALAADAEVAVVQAERRMISKDQEIVQFNQRRAAMEQQERPLLEQEVRLREQRSSLEEKEIRLRADVTQYFDNSRQGLGRSTSPLRRH